MESVNIVFKLTLALLALMQPHEVRDVLLQLLEELRLPTTMHTGDHFCTFRRFHIRKFILNMLDIVRNDDLADLSHIRTGGSNYMFLNDLYHNVYLFRGSPRDSRGVDLEAYITKKAFASFKQTNKGAPTLRIRRAANEVVVPHTLEELLSDNPPLELIEHEAALRTLWA